MSYPTYQQSFVKDIMLADKKITIQIGKFSEQTAAAVLITCGETVVHTTVALGRSVNLGYFPLQVEYVEKLYAGGIIKGSRWVKREGRPSDDAILKARVIDRTIRPLFPEGLKHEVQVVNTVFSYDGENNADMLALLATGIALEISPIPFVGPISGIRIGYQKDNQQYYFNPTESEMAKCDLDLIVSGTKDSVVMVEAGAKEVTEDIIIEAFKKAQVIFAHLGEEITAIAKEIGKPKKDLIVTLSDKEKAQKEKVQKLLSKSYEAKVSEIIKKEALLQTTDFEDVVDEISETLNKEESDDIIPRGLITSILAEAVKAEGRRMIIKDKIRPDGRATDEIRQITCEVDIFPRTHGSAMFKRGATQVCSITTLGSPSLGQHIEDIEGEEVRHYMHHYNMPPFASGEAGMIGSPKRREIGHGALAERALVPMLPSQEEFPYTIRVVSEVLSSNGSTSQASVCGSTMSLMAAGVPLKRPVAGIAMGLMSDGKDFVVLSDIQGLEDHVGDMDFKVAGTKEGITALQMDIKLTGLPLSVMEQALGQAKTGRMFILGKMLSCIDNPRTELSRYAPRIKQMTIPGDRIGELIGPGGKIIKGIIEKTGVDIDIEEDKDNGVGLVHLSAIDPEAINGAMQIITDMFRTVNIGDEFDGKVTRIESYGAFVEYLPGREGLVHVSQMSTNFVNSAEEIVKLGDTVHVRVSDFKDDGKIQLSMLTAEQAANQTKKPAPNNGGGNYGSKDFQNRKFSGPRKPAFGQHNNRY